MNAHYLWHNMSFCWFYPPPHFFIVSLCTSCTLLGFQVDAAQRSWRIRTAAEDRQGGGSHKGPRREFRLFFSGGVRSRKASDVVVYIISMKLDSLW